MIKYDDFQLHKSGDFELFYLVNEELRESNTFQYLFEGGGAVGRIIVKKTFFAY